MIKKIKKGGKKYMLKITVEIKEKDGDTSSVAVKVPKDVTKSTDNEKQTASVVYNAICEALGKLK